MQYRSCSYRYFKDTYASIQDGSCHDRYVVQYVAIGVQIRHYSTDLIMCICKQFAMPLSAIYTTCIVLLPDDASLYLTSADAKPNMSLRCMYTTTHTMAIITMAISHK
jgi:hypothetical protein